MNYLISTFNCDIFDKSMVTILANVKYKIKNFEHDVIVFPHNNSCPFVFSKRNKNNNCVKVKLGEDTYYFLFSKQSNDVFFTHFTFKSQTISITISNKIIITSNGKLICEKNVENIRFSHYEIDGDVCLIYFEGVRNFVAILKGSDLVFAEYYDECNFHKDEKFFMSKLNDSLNHGLVCHVEKSKVESYLVYLDDEELKLKEEFVPFVFLDCVKSKNFIYANSLLSDELKLDDAKQIANFIPEFDWFYPASENKFVLIKKNTLAGILDFVIDKSIVNIVNL